MPSDELARAKCVTHNCWASSGGNILQQKRRSDERYADSIRFGTVSIRSDGTSNIDIKCMYYILLKNKNPVHSRIRSEIVFTNLNMLMII